jgi:hypothetical protein
MQDHDPVGGNIKDYAVDGILRRDRALRSQVSGARIIAFDLLIADG